MPRAAVNGIEIEYETFGEPEDRPLLLIMGLGAQMTLWDDEFCEQLRDHGHFVVRYDARDTGLSTKLDGAGTPDLMAILAAVAGGRAPEAPYLLSDMADDAAGLLEALGLPAAHLVGASMGGMVAQSVAIQHTEKVLSLTSIMSTTGNPELPPAKPEAIQRLMRPAPEGRADYVEGFVETMKAIAGTGFPFDEERARERAEKLYERSFYPEGQRRHTAAVMASGSRKEALADVRVPTLVIHGKEDPLVVVEGGIDTHQAIAGSELLLIDGLGHEMPEAVVPRIVKAIVELTSKAATPA